MVGITAEPVYEASSGKAVLLAENLVFRIIERRTVQKWSLLG